MSMYQASTKDSVRDAAVSYFYEGLSVIPLTGKKSAIPWAIHQQDLAIPQTIHRWAKDGKFGNVGIVCGEVSHNLVVIDLDGLAAVEAFEKQFPYLLDTFTVLTGSGKGKHLYYRVDDLPPTTKISYPNHQGIELRANGCYVVAPPSLHPETRAPYRPQSNVSIRQLPHLNGVKHWIYSQLARKQESSKAGDERIKVVGNISRYAEAALSYECRDVRLAREGNRNNRLSIAAYNLGQIVGDNNLPRATVENSLLSAALQAGLNEQESRATIESGIEKGMAEPRSAQWLKRSK